MELHDASHLSLPNSIWHFNLKPTKFRTYSGPVCSGWRHLGNKVLGNRDQCTFQSVRIRLLNEAGSICGKSNERLDSPALALSWRLNLLFIFVNTYKAQIWASNLLTVFLFTTFYFQIIWHIKKLTIIVQRAPSTLYWGFSNDNRSCNSNNNSKAII